VTTPLYVNKFAVLRRYIDSIVVQRKTGTRIGSVHVEQKSARLQRFAVKMVKNEKNSDINKQCFKVQIKTPLRHDHFDRASENSV